MTNSETRNRIRALFASKRGPDLIDAIADEISELHALTRNLSDQLHQLSMFQAFAQRMQLLEEATDRPAQLPRRLRINASYLFVAENGFHGLEYEPNGRAFRWTGPRKDFSFNVYVDRSMPLRLRLDVFKMIDTLRQAQLLLLADGLSIPIELVETDNGYIGQALLPARPEARATSLVFVVPDVLQPDNEVDIRELGIAFRELSLAPADEADVAPTANLYASRQRIFGEGRTTADAANIDRAAPAGTIPQRVRIDASHLRDGGNMFFGLEYDLLHRPYRWTGPEKPFSITAVVERSRTAKLTLCISALIDRAKQTPLSAEIDGNQYELELTDGPDGMLAQFLVPPRATPGPTTFTFKVPAMLKAPGEDRRTLGVAFRYLTVDARGEMVETGGKNSAEEAVARSAAQ